MRLKKDSKKSFKKLTDMLVNAIYNGHYIAAKDGENIAFGRLVSYEFTHLGAAGQLSLVFEGGQHSIFALSELKSIKLVQHPDFLE
jgi:hypothetical protein